MRAAGKLFALAAITFFGGHAIALGLDRLRPEVALNLMSGLLALGAAALILLWNRHREGK